MDSVSLSYLLAHPTSLGLAVDRPLFLVVVVVAVVFYRFPIPTVAPRVTTLRTAAFACIVAGIAGVGITTSLPLNELTLVAAVDVSGSIDDKALQWSRRYLHAVASSLAPGDQLALITFAESAAIVSTSSSPGEIPEIVRPPEVGATDISAAIDQALALYSQGSQKALLLISDGNETVGSSRSRIETLRALCVRVDAVSPPPSATRDIRIARLMAPSVVPPTRPVPLRVVIRNSSGAHPALLNLYLDGRISDSIAIDLKADLSTFDMLLRPPAAGGHVVRAEVVSDGEDKVENNSREVSIVVRPETKIILATHQRYSPLAEVLESRGFSVTKIRPDRLPTHVAGYSAIHLVALEDLRGKDVSPKAAAAIEHFVRVRGGGMIFAGGVETFGDRALHGSDIEKMLPVTLEPRRPRPKKRDPLALFLVIDRSNSMGFNSRIGTLRDGEKLRYALKAGTAVVKQLKDHDWVGVIAFDARPHEIAPLRPLKTNRKQLLHALPRIVESGGTDFFDALESAGAQLAESRVGRKHVVLLTDGDTNRAGSGEYRAVISKLASAGISVTTIRIGDNTVNLKLLQDISEGTGGSFHHVEDAQMLPDLMLRDTSRALRPIAVRQERFFPAFGSEHRLLSDTHEGDIPHLSDYAFSKPKPSSESLLQVTRADRKDPILSVWRYGLGRVVAFTASPRDDAESWPAWDGFARFWSQLTFWTARGESDDNLAVEASRRSGATQLVVQSFDRSGSSGSLSGVLDTGGAPIEIHFTDTEPGRYEASTTSLPPGRYRLRLRLGGTGTVREVDTVVAVPSRLEEDMKEYDHSGDNQELLRELTLRTGGTLGAAARDFTARPTGTRTVSYSLVGFLIPLAMLAFFADIALRRIASLRPISVPDQDHP